jgi:hypothetical protein
MGAPSAEASHIVGQASTSTVLTTSAPRGGVTGQAITFTATVRPVAPGSGTPTGTVTFVDLNTGNTLGVATMSGNQAKLTTTALLPGSYRVAAMYDGDTQYVESTSLPITQVIRRPLTRVTAIYSTLVPATPIFVTGKVNVVAPGSGTPTGTVGVFVDGVLRANATVDANGNFLFDLLNGLTAGKHRFTYSYSGDSNFAASTTTQVVLISNGRQT